MVSAWNKLWLEPQLQFRGRKAHVAHPGFVAAWLRIGELRAEQVHCAPYNERVFRDALNQIRELTTSPADVWQSQLRHLCAAAGVAVVLVQEIPTAGVSGIAKWLTKVKALIQLSLKYRTDDQFWFAFFHESCRIVKHSKKQTFYESFGTSDDPDEKEANAFARVLLIPPSQVSRLSGLESRNAICAFAKSINISPSIVVGRLQLDKLLDSSYCNDLKKKYEWDANKVDNAMGY